MPSFFNRRTIIIAGIIVAIAIATAIIVIAFSNQQRQGINSVGGGSSATAPNVKFISFDSDKKDIKVGETTTVVYNIGNYEDRSISDARVTITMHPSGYEPYFSISNQTLRLPLMLGKNAA